MSERDIITEILEQPDIVVEILEQPDIVIEMEGQGPQGLQGPMGLQGPKGDTGEIGPQGEPGVDTVYVGTEEPSDSRYNVWIDPDGGSNVDTQMSDVSVNPVENKVIKAYVDSKTASIGSLATKQEVTNGLNTKQDKGNYALKSEIPSLDGLVNEQQLQQGLNTKQNKGNYALAGDIPTLVSQLQNNVGYQTQAEVLALIAQIPQFSISIVNSLPQTGNRMTIYLVAKEGTAGDIYNEYVWIESSSTYEYIGTTAVDLTDYIKNTDYATSSKAGIMRPANGLFVSGNTGAVLIAKASTAQIDARTDNYYPIVSSNLAYAVNSILPTMTQSEYDALATKDENSFYMIVEE